MQQSLIHTSVNPATVACTRFSVVNMHSANTARVHYKRRQQERYERDSHIQHWARDVQTCVQARGSTYTTIRLYRNMTANELLMSDQLMKTKQGAQDRSVPNGEKMLIT